MSAHCVPKRRVGAVGEEEPSALARIDPGLLARIDPHGPEAVHRRIIRSMNLSTCMLANEQLPCVE
jgi:hypothetical protein